MKTVDEVIAHINRKIITLKKELNSSYGAGYFYGCIVLSSQIEELENLLLSINKQEE